ncbi:AvrE-family type 3 secretion system effector [Enterobacter hormaechei]|nr:AvrE-family type 3 secretion system effector [Enterobacter hormaechei]
MARERRSPHCTATAGGRLHATVKDRMDNEHSCQLDANGVTPGWNLSESMVMDYQKGLRRSEPLPHAVVDCGRLGKLALMDGNVHFYDSTSQRWEPTSEKADRTGARQRRHADEGGGWRSEAVENQSGGQ